MLARQMLLERRRISVVKAIEQLAALQAQWPRAPYVGLWTRLERFERADLEGALHRKRVVKATLMRGTLHLATAADYPFYAVAAREARRLLWASTQRQLVAFIARSAPAIHRLSRARPIPITDPDRLHKDLLQYAITPRTREELIDFIARHEDVPRELATHLVWGFIAAHAMLVHAPESARFSADRAGDLIAAPAVFPRMRVPTFGDAVLRMVMRHLAAFGPATVDDISSWTSVRTTPIREALATLAQRVRAFSDERGRTLYDLADAPRPSADTPAPPRYLPKWDSTLLAYTPVERIRILPERHRPAVIAKNGDVAQTVLVDGMVAGTWAISQTSRAATITVTPFAKLARPDRVGLVEEGERLARFLAPESASHGVRIG